MLYKELLAELESFADDGYRDFHKRLLKNENIRVLGVRVPQMRKIAKSLVGNVDELLSFPDEYYEVTFIKLTAVSLLKWEEFIKYVSRCVPLIDNWATCDCFAPKCIEKHKEEFLPYIYTFFAEEQEFYQRFALTTLLHFYVEEKYYDKILQLITEAETDEYYYVHMAAAWLLAELIIKFYDQTVEFLKATIEASRKGLEVDKKTHNKAIQKACESFRLTAEQKTYLKGLKL